GADEVLPAFAARQRQVAGAHQLVVGQPGQEASVLVVGMRRYVQHVTHDRQSINRAHELARVRLMRRSCEHGTGHQCYRCTDERRMRQMHCAVHCHVKPMPRSLFSAYVETGMQASTLLPSAFGDRQARRAAVTRAAARTPSAALLAELEAQQAALPASAARQRALETL